MKEILPGDQGMPEEQIKVRIEQVIDYIRQYAGILVAYSGGVDSSTLAALAYMALGDKAVAVTADSRTLPRRELESSKTTAKSIGIRHIIIPYDELEEEGFSENPVDRCYHCKKGLFRILDRLARDLNIPAVADGTNASELEGHRPGHRASLECGILTPFADMGITKTEIREMARRLGLKVWDKPQQACLSSRFPYGRPITPSGLERVEKAEDYLYDLGITQCRVRDHDGIARIEVIPGEFDIVMSHASPIIEHLKCLGFTHITLDLEGFRSGSLDTL